MTWGQKGEGRKGGNALPLTFSAPPLAASALPHLRKGKTLTPFYAPLADKSKNKSLLNMAEANAKDPSYKDKPRCNKMLNGLKIGAALGGIGLFLGALSATDAAKVAYEKLQNGGQLSPYDKQELITAVANSGLMGAGSAAAKLQEIIQ